LTRPKKSVGQLEGIDFDAFFDHENFHHDKKFIESYLKHRQNKVARLRDTTFMMPTRKGNNNIIDDGV
jgi:hypothetical protein